jgi:hypothetical protein
MCLTSFFLILLTLLGLQGSLLAQTNTFPEFQGFRPGDVVRVQVEKPLIVLGQAMFQSQTPTNIVVLSKGDRYVLDKATVVLSLPQDLVRLATTASPSGSPQTTSNANSSIGNQEAQLLLLGVQQKVLGNYSDDKGYKEAATYYQDTVKRYLAGQITLSDIVDQAEHTLQKVDGYQPERANDPQFEGQIRYLREFVERAKHGETLQSTSKVE